MANKSEADSKFRLEMFISEEQFFKNKRRADQNVFENNVIETLTITACDTARPCDMKPPSWALPTNSVRLR